VSTGRASAPSFKKFASDAGIHLLVATSGGDDGAGPQLSPSGRKSAWRRSGGLLAAAFCLKTPLLWHARRTTRIGTEDIPKKSNPPTGAQLHPSPATVRSRRALFSDGESALAALRALVAATGTRGDGAEGTICAGKAHT
jgi:hypothetical protein